MFRQLLACGDRFPFRSRSVQPRLRGWRHPWRRYHQSANCGPTSSWKPPRWPLWPARPISAAYFVGDGAALYHQAARPKQQLAAHIVSLPYRRLPEGPSLRLLILYPRNHPGSEGGNRICVSLQTSFLAPTGPGHDSGVSSYEALSYCWDDPYAPLLLPKNVETVQGDEGEVLCPISVDERDSVLITANLFLALRALQHEDAPRALWVDALCINQSSPEEKSIQLPRMREIYSKAANVIIWLGEEDYWTPGSASVLARWSEIYQESRAKGLYQPEILSWLKEWKTFDKEEQMCFGALIRRAWFTRAWTFQELCLARHAQLRMGRYSIPWDRFRDACAAVIAAGQEHLVFEEHENIKTLHNFYDLCRRMPDPRARVRDERFQLSRLLQRARLQQATDPRDKIYTLLSIANPPSRHRGSYHVDYREPAGHTYRRFTRDMIREDGDLGILSAVHRARSPTKMVEYGVRTLFWEEVERWERDTGEKLNVDSQLVKFVEGKWLLKLRDGQRAQLPHSFRRPELSDAQSAVPGLPTWVPDFSNQDRVKYVATDTSIKSRAPSSRMRTRFPRPIAQQFSEGWPRYWLNKKFSYRIADGDVIFDTGDPDQLGVWGVRAGTVRRVFEMPFTSDPSVRIPINKYRWGLRDDDDGATDPRKFAGKAPPPPHPFNFDFTDRFLPVEEAKETGVYGDGPPWEEEAVLSAPVYKPTGERTCLAVLRALTADMLPISPRLPDSHKTTLFPFHYDWYFWNRGRNGLPRRFPTSAAASAFPWAAWMHTLEGRWANSPRAWEAWRILAQGLAVSRARLALWLRGGSAREAWQEFDTLELRGAERIKKLYGGFLLPSEGWDILEAAARSHAVGPPPPGLLKLRFLVAFAAALPLYALEVVFNYEWRYVWADGTMLQYVPGDMLVGLTIFLAWLWIDRFARGARTFERDASVPVGWEEKAAQVAVMRPLETETGSLSKDEVESVQGIWGISCEIQNAINRASWNREFFVTENGYIGIGPVGMRPGDEVWALIGGHVPFVLRPAAAPAGGGHSGAPARYQLVGESYMHGIMDGELWAENRRAWSSLDAMKERAEKVVLV